MFVCMYVYVCIGCLVRSAQVFECDVAPVGVRVQEDRKSRREDESSSCSTIELVIILVHDRMLLLMYVCMYVCVYVGCR